MSRAKTIFVVVTILALCGFSVYVNRDAFKGKDIQISSRTSPWMLERRGGKRLANVAGNPVTFGFDDYHRFTSIKVVAVSDIETNKYPHKLWELDSPSNSVPTMTFIYGSRIGGMKPATKGLAPEPLEPGVMYRLLVKTKDNRTAQHDFSTTKHE